MRRASHRRFWILLCILMILGGLGFLLYPPASDLWNRYRNSKLVDVYSKAVHDLTPDKTEAIWTKAHEYNEKHTTNTIVDAFKDEEEYVLTAPYDQLLNPSGDNIMGTIEIPKIQVKLPIFHGVGEESLQRGAGHLEGTSLPIGGKSTHSVLSAHRGLPSAILFTDLDQMAKGDLFYLHIMDAVFAYRVVDIQTVLPHQSELLAIQPDRDLCTLLTCTPYGVNSHRLLVTGERTTYIPDEATPVVEKDVAVLDTVIANWKITLIGVIVFLFFLFGLLLRNRRKKQKERKEQNARNEKNEPKEQQEQNERQVAERNKE
ncbi:class C sortase [Murdochiella massiliensis]|uniref:class C sortase n=1 Tax=Murdochiella massiliensis TaxID=1673723 RepID=UPI0008297563|nr:class C sortase [Murdochiella massiliensis]